MMRFWTTILAIAISFNMVATETDFSYKPWVAVHDFTVSPDLAKKDKTGWNIAEEMENKLAQTCKFRMVTRAKIAKVLKEKNIASSGSLSATDLGKVIQAEYIVTGEFKKDGDRVVMVAKLLDVSKHTGELEKSFDTWMYDDPADKMAESISYMITLLAEKLTMTPGEFLELGMDRVKTKDYESAFEAFREMQRVTPFDKIKEIMEETKRNPPPDSQLDIPATGRDAGKQFDSALMLMIKGENKTAAKLFCGIQKNQQVGELIKLVEIAKALAKDQSERLGTILDDASRKYWNAVQNKEQQEKDKDPRILCDEALAKLYGILNDKNLFLSQTTRRRIEQMAAKIESLKKEMYAGPSADGMWVVPDLEIAFVPVKPGILTGPASADKNNPQIRYRAKITKPFWIAKHEVTIQQFTKYMKSLPVNDRNDRHELEKGLNMDSEDCPVNEEYNMKRGSGPSWGDPSMPMTSVTWQGAMAFCKWLTAAEHTAKRLPEGYVYRLPTEAEWEYCCRAGNGDARYYYGDDMAALGDYGWFSENSGNMLHPAGKKKPNAWGIHDMVGNSWEWCYDWYDESFLSFDCENPVGPKNSPDSTKVVRGGGFTSNAEDMSCSARYNFDYKSGKKNIGFRIVCAPEI
jgi:formylglycine-generating enzyme required for sulfatase activity/TolB-like protein